GGGRGSSEPARAGTGGRRAHPGRCPAGRRSGGAGGSPRRTRGGRGGGDPPGDPAGARGPDSGRPGSFRAWVRRVGEARIMRGNLARRYARPLLELAREAGTLDASGNELAAAAAAFAEPRLRAVVLNPVIAGVARRKIVGEVVAALGVSTQVGNLVKLLADRG